MNDGFFSLSRESCFPFQKKGRSMRLPGIAGLITAAITGRGNREVHAVQPRWGQTPRRGVFFREVGRARFSVLSSLFFSVVVEKSKPPR